MRRYRVHVTVSLCILKLLAEDRRRREEEIATEKAQREDKFAKEQARLEEERQIPGRENEKQMETHTWWLSRS